MSGGIRTGIGGNEERGVSINNVNLGVEGDPYFQYPLYKPTSLCKLN